MPNYIYNGNIYLSVILDINSKAKSVAKITLLVLLDCLF